MVRRLLFIVLLCCSGSAWAGFSAPTTQRCYNSVTTGASVACTLPGAITNGDVVLVHVLHFVGRSLTSVKDNAGSPNTYAQGCSGTNDASAGTSCFAWFIAAGTTGTTITATISGTCTACSIDVNEFGVSGGTASLDTSVATGNGTGTVNTPSITPAGSGELYFATCADAASCTGVAGSWTACGHGLGSFTEECEFQLSVGSATAVAFTGSTSQVYDSTIIAFKFTASSTTPEINKRQKLEQIDPGY
jgi:hypothetical protein